MRRLVPLTLGAWMLPVIVTAIAVPIAAAFAVGPHLGMAAGALAAVTLIVIAARARYDEPIEVAARVDARHRVLVVATSVLDDPVAVDELAAIAREGVRVSTGSMEAEVLVLAPVLQGRLARWASDLGEARDEAQRRLAVSIAALSAAGLDARGRVGDSDPVLAVEDELRTFPAQEVVLLAGPALESGQIDDMRRRLDRPVRLLTGTW